MLTSLAPFHILMGDHGKWTTCHGCPSEKQKWKNTRWACLPSDGYMRGKINFSSGISITESYTVPREMQISFYLQRNNLISIVSVNPHWIDILQVFSSIYEYSETVYYKIFELIIFNIYPTSK